LREISCPRFIEELEVYSLARKMAVAVYRITKNFPKDEMYGLSSQMRRAAVSIISNLSEGGSRITDAELKIF